MSFAIVLLGVDAAPAPDFAYDRGISLAVQTLAITGSDGIEMRDLTFQSDDCRVGASLVRPIDRARRAGT